MYICIQLICVSTLYMSFGACLYQLGVATLETDIFAHSSLQMAQAQSDWMESVCEEQFSSLATDNWNFLWSLRGTFYHEYALIIA